VEQGEKQIMAEQVLLLAFLHLLQLFEQQDLVLVM
jgi:hypothetical protein